MVTKIYIPGLINGSTGSVAYLAVTDNSDGTLTLNTTTGGSAKLYIPGLVDGSHQNVPVYLLATDNGGDVYTLNTA